MSTLQVINAKHPSSASNNLVLDASGNAAFAGNVTSAGMVVPSSSFLRNRIINGDYRIDQRNNGASGTALGYNLDRWIYGSNLTGRFTWQRNQGSVTPPPGFTNYIGFTTTSSLPVLGASDYFHFGQPIEGFNVSDLAFGTANAAPVTVSFWVRSSLTGTFGAVLRNGASSYAYPFQYTISAANTWEREVITIPGAVAGTWATDNGAGMSLLFGLGVGTSLSAPANAWIAQDVASASGVSVVGTLGATLFVTGVQLEVGSVATPFERRQYGQELALCQRYFLAATYFVNSASVGRNCAMFPAAMRIAPTITGGGSGYASSVVTTVGFCNDQTAGAQQNLTFNAEF